jgi:hypothetical protein
VLAATSNPKAFWYLTRGTGMVSLVLLTISLALGISEAVRYARPGWPRFVLAALHKNASLLALAFLGVHILTSVADSFAPIRLADAVIPFAGRYRPVWLGLGALAFDLLLALIATSLVRERIGYRWWRGVHWAAYACWPIAFMHGLGTGTDTRARWGLLVNLVCLAAIVGAVWWRIALTRTAAPRVRVAASFATVAIAVGVVGWMVAEPLRPGWARKAGTPEALVATSPAPSGSTSVLQAPFESPITGTIRAAQPAGSTRESVVINAQVAAVRARLHVVIGGTALRDGGVAMDDSSVRLGTGDAAGAYRGSVTSLVGNDLVASLQDRAGHHMVLTVHIANTGANRVSGKVTARPGGSFDDS